MGVQVRRLAPGERAEARELRGHLVLHRRGVTGRHHLVQAAPLVVAVDPLGQVEVQADPRSGWSAAAATASSVASP
jgi:hypothetical protein